LIEELTSYIQNLYIKEKGEQKGNLTLLLLYILYLKHIFLSHVTLTVYDKFVTDAKNKSFLNII
jgi:hypothetical protein